MEIKERIKQLRLSKSLTQQEFADELGIKKVLIAHWETGRANPGLENLTTICNKYSITADWLLFGKNQNIAEVAINEPESVYGKETKRKEKGHDAVVASVAEMTERIIISSKNAALERKELAIQNKTVVKLMEQCLAVMMKKPVEEIAEMTNKIYLSVRESFESEGR